MRGLFVALLVIIAAGVASAQDVVYRPSATTTEWRAMASDVGMASAQICLVLCVHAQAVADFTDPANHVGCAPVGTIDHDGTTVPGSMGAVSNPLGAGDQCYHAVAISTSGVVSNPSDNVATVQDLPPPPIFVQ